MKTIQEKMMNYKRLDFKEISPLVFEHFLAHFFKGGKLILGVNISNPFLTHKQKTPSFNIYKGRNGELIYKDHATGDIGNCVSFVAKFKNIDRIEAIREIKKIINIL